MLTGMFYAYSYTLSGSRKRKSEQMTSVHQFVTKTGFKRRNILLLRFATNTTPTFSFQLLLETALQMKRPEPTCILHITNSSARICKDCVHDYRVAYRNQRLHIGTTYMPG